MNIHHLELFYYVARFRGISEAVRKIPYGIQQPAVSVQVSQLEHSLGVVLFRRRPFALTPAGEQLFAFIEPFFGNLDNLALQLRGAASQHIRIGASEVVLREHLPAVIENVRAKYPGVRVTLRQGYQPELEVWLKSHELDLAVTLLERKPPAGLQALTLMEIPLVLLVPRRSPFKSAAQLWEQDRISETLISLPASESIVKSFQEELHRREVDWPTGMEVSSLLLVESYVENGYGIGLSVLQPLSKISSKVRLLPLTDFPAARLGVLWSGKQNPLIEPFVSAIKARADQVQQAAAANQSIHRPFSSPCPRLTID